MKLKKNQTNELLNYFFSFVNLDIDKVTFDDLPVVAMSYVRFAFHDDGESDFSNYKAKYDLLSESAFNQSDKKLLETKTFLKAVQDNLREKLNGLIGKEPSTPLKQQGTRVLAVIDDKFVEKFESKKVQKGKLDSDSEKEKATSSFADILINGNLTPSRFKRCKKCESYFYQATARNKEYCSNNCSSALRQRGYQKNLKKKNK